MNRKFRIVSINISTEKGTKKKPIKKVELKKDFGIIGDAHAKNWHRQISLLGLEDIATMQGKGLELKPGDFAENITTAGVNLAKLPIGQKISVNDSLLEVTQIGKECHHHCEIYKTVGDCVMPKKGIFVKVLIGGKIKTNDIGILIN